MLNIERYDQKAMGLYVVASRNWSALGNLGLHFGINKNLYKKYLGNYLRHKLSNNQTWFKNFNKYFNSEQVGNDNNK